MAFQNYFIDPRQLLGSGAYAKVYGGFRKSDRAPFAFKQFDPSAPIHVFQTELAIMRKLKEHSHPSIVFVEDVLMKPPNIPIIILEKLSGGDLFEYILNKKSFTEKEAARWTTQFLSALHSLHTEANIIHRDVKPENIVFSSTLPNAELKLVDFGLSCEIHPDLLQEGLIGRDVVGTKGYLSPEIILQRRYGPACDVWSSGATLYCLLAGIPAFDSESKNLNRNIVQGKYYPLTTKYWDRVSDSAKNLVSRMLTVDLAQRISIPEILSHPWIVQHTTPTPPVPVPSPLSSSSPSSSEIDSSISPASSFSLAASPPASFYFTPASSSSSSSVSSSPSPSPSSVSTTSTLSSSSSSSSSLGVSPSTTLTPQTSTLAIHSHSPTPPTSTSTSPSTSTSISTTTTTTSEKETSQEGEEGEGEGEGEEGVNLVDMDMLTRISRMNAQAKFRRGVRAVIMVNKWRKVSLDRALLQERFSGVGEITQLNSESSSSTSSSSFSSSSSSSSSTPMDTESDSSLSSLSSLSTTTTTTISSSSSTPPTSSSSSPLDTIKFTPDQIFSLKQSFKSYVSSLPPLPPTTSSPSSSFSSSPTLFSPTSSSSAFSPGIFPSHPVPTTSFISESSISFPQFCEVVRSSGLGVLANPAIFQVFDRDGNGEVDYREFLSTLALYCTQESEEGEREREREREGEREGEREEREGDVMEEERIREGDERKEKERDIIQSSFPSLTPPLPPPPPSLTTPTSSSSFSTASSTPMTPLTPSKLSNIQFYFDLIDADNSGSLSLEEVSSVMGLLFMREEEEKQQQQLHHNNHHVTGGGGRGGEEEEELMKTGVEEEEGDEKEEKRRRANIEESGSSLNITIDSSPRSLMAPLSSPHSPIPPSLSSTPSSTEFFSILFDEMDLNKDGQISFEEFSHWAGKNFKRLRRLIQ